MKRRLASALQNRLRSERWSAARPVRCDTPMRPAIPPPLTARIDHSYPAALRRAAAEITRSDHAMRLAGSYLFAHRPQASALAGLRYR